MTAPTLAWGKVCLFSLPDGGHLYGREFELLPAGTMFAASVILHGIIGVDAVVGSDNVARIPSNAQIFIYPIRDTDPAELRLYEADINDGYKQRELQDAQG